MKTKIIIYSSVISCIIVFSSCSDNSQKVVDEMVNQVGYFRGFVIGDDKEKIKPAESAYINNNKGKVLIDDVDNKLVYRVYFSSEAEEGEYIDIMYAFSENGKLNAAIMQYTCHADKNASEKKSKALNKIREKMNLLYGEPQKTVYPNSYTYTPDKNKYYITITLNEGHSTNSFDIHTNFDSRTAFKFFSKKIKNFKFLRDITLGYQCGEVEVPQDRLWEVCIIHYINSPDDSVAKISEDFPLIDSSDVANICRCEPTVDDNKYVYYNYCIDLTCISPKANQILHQAYTYNPITDNADLNYRVISNKYIPPGSTFGVNASISGSKYVILLKEYEILDKEAYKALEQYVTDAGIPRPKFDEYFSEDLIDK